MKYNVEERLQQQMDDVAEEIRNHGKDSLYLSGQKVCGGRIIVDISVDCLALYYTPFSSHCIARHLGPVSSPPCRFLYIRRLLVVQLAGGIF